MARIDDKKLLLEGTTVATSSGAGYGLEIELTTNSAGTIQAISPSDILKEGIDYTAGTPLIINHPTGINADIEVNTVNGTGGVTSITVTSGGTKYFDIGVLYNPSIITANLVELDWYDTERDCEDPMYLTDAYNNIRWYTDGTYTEYKEFMALGNLGSISAIEEGFDLSSYGITLTLSGIPLEMREDAFVEANFKTAYQNRACRIYTVYLDRSYNVISEPVLLFAGQMDECNLDISSTITMQLSVASRLINWEIPRGGRYNTNDQQVWFPADTGFDLIPDLIDKELDWGGDGTGNEGVLGSGGGSTDYNHYDNWGETIDIGIVTPLYDTATPGSPPVGPSF